MDSTTSRRWRTVDIVVAAVLAVAFGVVFQVWNTVIWNLFVGPAAALVYGAWLIPAVLAPLIVRKPGAAFFTETVAAAVSLALGSPYGAMTLVYGMAQGAAAEVAFAATRYRNYGLAVALTAGGLAGLEATVFDVLYTYRESDFGTFQLPYILFGLASGLVVAGLGSWALTRALAGTGALDRFPAGRERLSV